MPIYDYYCDECQVTLEGPLEKYNSKSSQFCQTPKCGNQMRRLISSPKFVFKGEITQLGKGKQGFNTGFSALDNLSDDIVDTTPPEDLGKVMK